VLLAGIDADVVIVLYDTCAVTPMLPVGPAAPVYPVLPPMLPLIEEIDDTMRYPAYIVTVEMVEPVSVENPLSVNPGAVMEDAFSVETVSVEFTIPKFALKLDTTTVDAVKVDPVSVENPLSVNPGAVMDDA